MSHAVPTRLKILRGNPGQRPLATKEPEPIALVEPPPAPESLTGYARAEWERVTEELYRLRLLVAIDIQPLAAYCQAYAAWRTAVEKLNAMAEQDPVTAGLLVRTRLGELTQNPLLQTIHRTGNDMVRYAVEFGFTPAARSRINTVAAQPAPGKFDGLIAAAS